MNALRFPVAAVLAAAFSVTVFWFLWTLIAGTVGIGELKPAVKIEFTPMRRDTQTESKRDKPQPPKPVRAPTVPTIATGTSNLSGQSIGNIDFDVDTSFGGIDINPGSDRDVIPLVRINPDYPRRAQSRGIEGWVQVEFTITPAGTVLDPVVIDSDPKGTFESAAIKAISRWKYNPKVEQGRAVERRGIRVVLRFELEG